MSMQDYSHDVNLQKFDTEIAIYTQYAQTYADYNGCLPQDDDAADHYRQSIRAIRVG